MSGLDQLVGSQDLQFGGNVKISQPNFKVIRYSISNKIFKNKRGFEILFNTFNWLF